MDGHSPGAGVCGEGFSSKNGIQFSFLFQAMFEPLQWVSNATRTGGQLREEDHLREARVVRPSHMSSPPQFWFHDECLNAWHVGCAQQFCVGDSIFPGDVNNLAKASEVKLIEFFGIAAKFHSHRAGTALCDCHLVPKVMPCSPQTHVHNLLKEAPALASLFDTSLSMLQLG